MIPVIIWKAHYMLLSSKGRVWKESHSQRALEISGCITKKKKKKKSAQGKTALFFFFFLQANTKENYMFRNIGHKVLEHSLALRLKIAGNKIEKSWIKESH